MIGHELVCGKVMIRSLELYEMLGRPRKKYRSWIHRHVLQNNALESPRDYIMVKKGTIGQGNVVQVLLSVSVSKAICFKTGTIVGKNIRYFIEDSLEK